MKPILFVDFVARMNNAKRQHQKFTYILNSKKVRQTLSLMYQSNLILSYFPITEKLLKVDLKYINNKCAYKSLQLVSLPSKKKNVNANLKN